MEQLLFDLNPNPMWIYDLESLRILKVNQAAIDKYGYSSKEFLTLTVKDIRPEESIPALEKAIKTLKTDGLHDSGVHLHQAKGGEVFYVQVTSQPFPYKECDARLVSVYDITERIKAEENARNAYQELAHHIGNSPLAMIKWDSEFKVIEWSKRAEKIIGYKESEILGKTPFAFGFVDYRDANLLIRKMHELKSGKKNQNQLEIRLFSKNNTIIHIRIHSSALRNSKGELKSVLMLIENVSGQKKTETRYQRLFEAANDGICLLKGDTFIECNKRMEEIFEADKDEIVGSTPYDFSPEYQPGGQLSKEKAIQEINKALETDANIFEWKHQTAAGNLIDTQVSLSKIDLYDAIYVQAIVRDITEKKKNEEQVRLQGELFKQLFQNSPIGIVMIDRHDEVMMVNPSFEKIFEFTGQEVEGKNIDEFVVPERLKEDARHFNKKRNQGVAIKDETIRVRKDGSEVNVLIGSVPVFQEDEKIAIYGMYIDITERKKAEKALKESKQRVIRSLREKEILLSEIHHRVKNNLAVISGLIQLQVYNTDDEKARKALTDSQLRIHSMALIHEKLYKSDDLADIDFSNYINELIDSIKHALQNNDRIITVNTHAESIYLDVNQAVPTALILNEMVTNAYEHAFRGRKEGNIDIVVKQLKNTIHLEVKDNGVGLSASFEELKKGSLGMKLIESLTRQLGGSLDIKSGSGTYYILEFEKQENAGSGKGLF